MVAPDVRINGVFPFNKDAVLFEPFSVDFGDIGKVDTGVRDAFVGRAGRDHGEHVGVGVARRVNHDNGDPNVLVWNDGGVVGNDLDHQRQGGRTPQACNFEGVAGEVALLPDFSVEVVGCSEDVVGRCIACLGEFEVQQKGPTVVVGTVGQREVGQSVGSRVVVDVVNGGHADLCQVGQVDVSSQVVDGDRHEVLNIGLYQTGHTVGKRTALRDDEGR